MILHHGIRLHHIRTNLVAKSDLLNLSPDVRHLLRLLLLFQKLKLYLEHLHGLLSIMMLRTLILTLHHNPGGKVGNTDRRRCLVDMLPACAAGPVSVNLQIVIRNLNINLIRNIRHHVARGERSLPLPCRIKRRDPNQTVYALLRFQIPIGILSIHFKGHGLGSCDIPIQIIQHLDREAFLLCPPTIHAIEHVRPVTRLRPACTRMDGHDGITGIILSRQKGLNPKPFKYAFKLLNLRLNLLHHRSIIFLVSHLNEKTDILIRSIQPSDGIH